jgi:hypothetical protein
MAARAADVFSPTMALPTTSITTLVRTYPLLLSLEIQALLLSHLCTDHHLFLEVLVALLLNHL